MGAVSFLLLLACANTCALILGRNAARHAEFAMRAALGSGARRIFEQLLGRKPVAHTSDSAFQMIRRPHARRGIGLSAWWATHDRSHTTATCGRPNCEP